LFFYIIKYASKQLQHIAFVAEYFGKTMTDRLDKQDKQCLAFVKVGGGISPALWDEQDFQIFYSHNWEIQRFVYKPPTANRAI
jgi:hypothetical protein